MVLVEGIVQGVGFRPFAYRLATSLGVTGTVRNDGTRVIINASGSVAALDTLVQLLRDSAPPLARVERLTIVACDTLAETSGFTIAESTSADQLSASGVRLTPDAGICERCEAELLEASNRRYRHAFISCTDCGPRWSMLEALPYDRVRTSMQSLPLCAACASEYQNPADRRFHAESICCPSCGPSLRAYAPDGVAHGANAEAIAAAAKVLRTGGIVALHGIGGFHLAVSAVREEAVRHLRERKHRPAKPLAVMVRTIADARQLVHLDEIDVAALLRAERPVVIAPMRRAVEDALPLAANIAPGLVELGVMLPSTALHHLLLHDVGGPLVMTSGNASGEPLAATPDDAWRDLSGIADLLLVHDRAVLAPSDDTVLRHSDDGLVMMRRARGWSPAVHRLPVATVGGVVALGGDLKAAVAVAEGQRAWLSPYLGDQSSLAVQQRTAHVIERLVRLSGIVPRIVACDAHPGYASTAMAERWQQHAASTPWTKVHGEVPFELVKVQHHHAHVAAVMAEHEITAPVIALAFDGAGWGTDGTMWGGEILMADLAHIQRIGALDTMPLVGGDLASREPWRAAIGWLHGTPGDALRMALQGVSPEQRAVATAVLTHSNNVRSSSMGRLFDAAAAVLRCCSTNSYEGEAAARLEAMAQGVAARHGTPFPFIEPMCAGDIWHLDPRPALERLVVSSGGASSPAARAAAWHDAVAATAVAAALRALDEQHAVLGAQAGVVLCGGTFQNVRLLTAVSRGLRQRGVTVYTARDLPSNDGALAIGQLAIIAAVQTTLAGRTH